MHLFIEPLDVWLFRDGRPFDAADDHHAASRFPPYPTVIQGVIRSHHLVVQKVSLNDPRQIAETVGTATNFGAFRMRGPFVARRETDGRVLRYFPQPADAIVVENMSIEIRPLQPAEPRAAIRTSARTSLLLGPDEEPRKGVPDLWLSEPNLLAYLAGQPVTGTPSHELFLFENRFGIALQPSGTTEEGKLYDVAYVRPCEHVGLAVEVTGYESWPETGLLRMGGEGRSGQFVQYSGSLWSPIPSPLPPRFKLYFATPAFFMAGWRPEAWEQFFEGTVRLEAAAVLRYESIGGRDLTKRGTHGHKDARRFVPAGSVYYFSSTGSTRLRTNLIQSAITEWGAEIGFGQVIIKEWEYNV
ncbi:MAG: hypothetical protein M5U01_24795 [Ardenticatenaceae bacterium]|nr:hypothetical protein [Ardenticatenaceae bacterium]